MEKQMDYDFLEQKARRRSRMGKSVTYFLLTIWALMVLFPFYWMILTSLKSYSAYNTRSTSSVFPVPEGPIIIVFTFIAMFLMRRYQSFSSM